MSRESDIEGMDTLVTTKPPVVSPDDSKFSPELLLATAVLLLEGLSANILSPDTLYLSFMRAKDLGVRAGLDEQQLVDALMHLHERMEGQRKRNSMASMF